MEELLQAEIARLETSLTEWRKRKAEAVEQIFLTEGAKQGLLLALELCKKNSPPTVAE